MTTSDRREFQRLRLTRPILAQIGRKPALVLDIGVTGAFLEHYGRMSRGERFELSFRWQGETVLFACEAVRSDVVQDPGGDGKSAVSHTGVRFVEADAGARERLGEMIATWVGRILAAQKANAAGKLERSAGESVLARLGEARRLRTRGFVTWRLKEQGWSRALSRSPQQPADGFTVAAWEDEEEVAALCATYEIADDEGRRLIRLVAELSASSARE